MCSRGVVSVVLLHASGFSFGYSVALPVVLEALAVPAV